MITGVIVASTIRDVAAYSGVSLGTISKYINGGVVKEKTRQKIEEAIKHLKYRPNNIAKGLRNARTFTVGVLMSKLNSDFNGIIISALEEYLLPLGYSVIVSECHENETMEIEKIKFLLHHMVDGIVIMPYASSGKQIEVIEENKTPFVVIDQLLQWHKTDGVVLDNAAAIEEPVETLIKMKHRDIAIITGDMALFTARGRFAGYEKAMNRNGISIREEYVRNGSYSISGGYEATLDLFRLKKPPSALVISNYDMTIGAILAVHFLHKSVPDELSLIGFDDFPLTRVVSPPLSIISQPMVEMGRSAARLLFRRISGDYSGYPELIVHKAEMKLTESIKPLSKKRPI
jgi:DNA-binding LacI/PurR family transcriptional regulator